MRFFTALALGLTLLGGVRAAELPAVTVPAFTNAPGPLAQRALALTRRELVAIHNDLKPWAKDPRAKLLTDGRHTEHGIRPNTQVLLACAVVARWGATAEERAGALADLVALLRFVAPTHSQGTLLANDGGKWQAQWQSALWAFQAGQAAWLVWDRLDAELQELVAHLVSAEADRFLKASPPCQIKNDTKAEENAWNSLAPALAANLFPRHPRAPAWRVAAQRWQLSSFLTEDDTQSDRRVDGRPLRGYRLGANIHPDYTLENHDRVHPSYMACIGLLLGQDICYRWAGQPPPEALRFNAAPIYDHLKFLTHPDGRSHFPNGQDWELHRVSPALHAEMNVLCGDAEAARLERAALDTCERMQARSPDGRSLLPGEYFFPSLPGMYAHAYAATFLLHLTLGEGVAPVSAAEFERRLAGVRYFQHGAFLAQRTPAGFTSFSWGRLVMGQAIPFDADLLGSPLEHSFVGHIAAGQAAGLVVEAVNAVTNRDHYAVSALLGRAGGAVAQQLVFASLPEGRVLYVERVTARRAVTLTHYETGLLGVLNEPEWVHQGGPRRVKFAGGEWLVDGRRAAAARTLPGPWLNLDNLWGLAAAGVEGWRYQATSQITRGRREQRLAWPPPAQHRFARDELIAQRVLVVGLNETALATAARARLLTQQAQFTSGTLVLPLGGWRLTADFVHPLPVVKLERSQP